MRCASQIKKFNDRDFLFGEGMIADGELEEELLVRLPRFPVSKRYVRRSDEVCSERLARSF